MMRRELRELGRLAAPIAVAHLGFVLLGAVDTAVVGRLGEVQLGAVGLAGAIFFGFALLGMGLTMGVEPLIAQALGAGEEGCARTTMWQGVWIALLVSLPLMALTYLVAELLEPIGIEPVTAEHARRYLAARLIGLPPLLLFSVLRSYLQARGLTRPMVIAAVLANVLNLPLNWLLVFGDAGLERWGLAPVGMPALGVVGAGYTSSAVIFLQLAVVVFAVQKSRAGACFQRRPQRPAFGRAVALGLPIGLQRMVEVGMFSLTGLLMGKLSTQAIASHQIAMTLASATFMVPLGISAAAAVRVGRAIGAGDQTAMRRAGLVSLGAGAAFMSLCALTLLMMPAELAGVLTDKPAIIAAARPLLLVAALFQIADGVQVVALGVLRGMGDTRGPLWINVLAHYVLGLPLGVALAFGTDTGPVGLWWGMLAGLTTVAAALSWRFVHRSARPVARL